MSHICVVELGHHWFRYWLVACSAPSHYLNQCWNSVNWTFRNKLQWNFNRISNIFIQEIAFESFVCKMASILSQPQWVNWPYDSEPDRVTTINLGVWRASIWLHTYPSLQKSWLPATWWHHQMETISKLLALYEGKPPVTGGFRSQRSVTQSFDVFFDLRLNKWLKEQSRCQWCETPSHSIWCHCNEITAYWHHRTRYYKQN